MITLEEVNKEIEKLEKGKMTCSSCQLLASLYIIKDHLWKPPIPERMEMIQTPLPASV